MIWSITQIKNVLAIDVSSELLDENPQCEGVCFNSKNIQKNEIFLALPGNKSDGHQFIQHAFENGAALAIASKKQDIHNLDPKYNKYILHVPDVFDALLKMAQYKRKISKAKFIAITGSLGKTSTRKLIHHILAQYGPTYSSMHNFNNFLGINIVLASMPDDIEYAVIETGMDMHGQMTRLTNIIVPDIAVILRITSVHIESFKSVDDIAKAKCEILSSMKNHSHVILDADMETYDTCLNYINCSNIKELFTFGYHENANARLIDHPTDKGQAILFSLFDHKISIMNANFLPMHLQKNLAILLLLCHIFKLNIKKISNGLQNFTLPLGRGSIINVTYKDQTFQVIGDYYNAHPESVIAGINSMCKSFPKQKKIAILGDMLGLGKLTKELHVSLIEHINNAPLEKLILVGDVMSQIVDSITPNIHVKAFKNVEALIQNIDDIKLHENIVFIKGSRDIQLEKIVEYFGIKNLIE